MVEGVPGLPKASGERDDVEGKTERKLKLVMKETSNLPLQKAEQRHAFF